MSTQVFLTHFMHHAFHLHALTELTELMAEEACRSEIKGRRHMRDVYLLRQVPYSSVEDSLMNSDQYTR